MTDSQIDEAILSVTRERWSKVAMVIADAVRALCGHLPEGDTEWNLVANRIEALVKDGRLLAQGNIEHWRHSEVRKPS